MRTIHLLQPVLAVALTAAACSTCARSVSSEEHIRISEQRQEIQSLVAGRQFEEAETLARDLLAAISTAGEKRSVDHARVLDDLADILRRSKPRDTDALTEALRLADGAIDIKTALVPDGFLELAHSHKVRGDVLYRLARYDEARQSYETALAYRDEVPDVQDPELASLLNNLSVTTHVPAARLTYAKRLVAVREAIFERNDPRLAKARRILADFHLDAGRAAEARPLLEEARRSLETDVDATFLELKDVLAALGRLAAFEGDLVGSHELYAESLGLLQSRLEPDNPRLALPRSVLARSHINLGELKPAYCLLLDALEHLDERVMPSHVAQIHHDLGTVHLLARNLDLAAEHLEQARTLRAAHDPRNFSTTLRLLAIVRRGQGRLDEAMELMEEAVEHSRSTLGPDRFLTAFDVATMAYHVMDQGRLERAEALYAEALPTLQRVLARGAPAVGALGAVKLGYAELRARQGNWTAALDLAEEIEERRRELVDLAGAAWAEDRVLRIARRLVLGLPVAMSVALHCGGDPELVEKAWTTVARSRGLVVESIALRQALQRESGVSGSAASLHEFQEAASRYTNLVVLGPPETGTDEYFDELHEARARLQNAEETFTRTSWRYASRHSQRATTIADVARALPAGSGLLAYVQHQVLPTSAQAVPGPGFVYSALVVTGSGAQPRIVSLGAMDEVNRRIDRWLGTRGRPAKEFLAAGDSLRILIWDPVAPLLGDVDRVFVVPDGAIHLVHLATLPGRDGSYVIESAPRLHYLSSERELLSDSGEAEGSRPPGASRRLLAVGSPDFDALSAFEMGRALSVARSGETKEPAETRKDVEGGGFETLVFRPLPESGTEARKVARIWESHYGTGTTRLLMGRQATEAAVRQAMPGQTVVHVASHGFVVDEGREPTREVLDQFVCDPAGGTPSRVSMSSNPLLKFGIALAGANHRVLAREGEENGLLTALEVASLDLTGVEWAVLSACESGMGSAFAGEGVFGLRRAFRMAGAQTLIMSMWPVDDTLARRWMAELYRARFVRGLDTDEAMQETSLLFLHAARAQAETPHPNSWAPFVAVGGWR